MQEKILELENKITEMEEEKGNLQLRLVDFEDMTGNYLSFFTYLSSRIIVTCVNKT